MNEQLNVTPQELAGAADKLELLLYHDHAAAVRAALALLAQMNPMSLADGDAAAVTPSDGSQR